MDHISRVAVFVAVVEQQGFSGAARKLGMTGSAVSKQVGNLENQLGVKLLRRTTRLVTLTEEGALYYKRARRALEDLKEAEYQLQELKMNPTGGLKINAPMSFGNKYLVQPIATFAKTYPDVVIDAEFDDRIVDIIGEGYDVVIRIAALTDSSLMAKKLVDCPLYLCASPAYLLEKGTPSHVEELRAHRHIVFSRHGLGAEWRYKAKDGTVGLVSFDCAFRANNAEMMLEAALQGIGIALLPSFMVADALQSGQLVHVLPDYSTFPERHIYALYPPNRHLSTKVKLFVEWISHACKELAC